MATKCWIEVPDIEEIVSVPSEGYAPFFFPADGDMLPFFFTEETFTKVYSALRNGAQSTYGDEGRQVLWDFLQNVEYPVTICEKMIDCITNDSDVRDALYDWLSTDPRAKNLIQDIVSKGSSGGGGVGVTADNDDDLFGACTFLVDTMHDAIVDFNQKAELGTNLRERANIILQAIPVFGDAIAAIPEYIDELFDNVIEIFEGQYTETPITGSRDRLRCGLFCLARLNDRSLTWQLIQTYFWDLVSFESTIPNLALDFVGFLATGSWAGQDVVNVSFANMATAMSVGSKFGEAVFPNLQTLMALGLNNPDSDWHTLCLDCPTGWSHDFPDDNGWNDFTLEAFGGSTTIVADGKIKGQTNVSNNAVFINFKITVNADVQNVSFTVEFNLASGVEQDFNLYIDGTLVESINLAALTSPHTMSYPAGENGSHVYEVLGGVFGTTAAGRVLNVTASTWLGNGIDPFI